LRDHTEVLEISIYWRQKHEEHHLTEGITAGNEEFYYENKQFMTLLYKILSDFFQR
jgi:hypothetical protein